MRDDFPGETGEQVVEGLDSSAPHQVCVAGLGNAPARFGPVGEAVALDDGDVGEVREAAAASRPVALAPMTTAVGRRGTIPSAMVMRAFCAGHASADVLENAGPVQGESDAFDVAAHDRAAPRPRDVGDGRSTLPVGAEGGTDRDGSGDTVRVVFLDVPGPCGLAGPLVEDRVHVGAERAQRVVDALPALQKPQVEWGPRSEARCLPAGLRDLQGLHADGPRPVRAGVDEARSGQRCLAPPGADVVGQLVEETVPIRCVGVDEEVAAVLGPRVSSWQSEAIPGPPS